MNFANPILAVAVAVAALSATALCSLTPPTRASGQCALLPSLRRRLRKSTSTIFTIN